MQTFVPYPDVILSVRCLDWERLGKQRAECEQILNALTLPEYGWKHHTAVVMWRGCEEYLKHYMNECIREWVRRGYNNEMPYNKLDLSRIEAPYWWGGMIHASHRSNLLRKDAEFYGQYGWSEGPDLPYYWPKNRVQESPRWAGNQKKKSQKT